MFLFSEVFSSVVLFLFLSHPHNFVYCENCIGGFWHDCCRLIKDLWMYLINIEKCFVAFWQCSGCENFNVTSQVYFCGFVYFSKQSTHHFWDTLNTMSHMHCVGQLLNGWISTTDEVGTSQIILIVRRFVLACPYLKLKNVNGPGERPFSFKTPHFW